MKQHARLENYKLPIYLEHRMPVGETWEMKLNRYRAGRSSRALGAKRMVLNFILKSLGCHYTILSKGEEF